MVTIYWVSLSYATYVVTVKDDVVVEAAPIAKWMIGKSWDYCREWAEKKGATIKVITSGHPISEVVRVLRFPRE